MSWLEELEHAVLDLRYLLDRGYPRDRAVSFVGDRYRLTKKFRNLLYRCVFSSSKAVEHRRGMLEARELEAKRLCIDGYNVLITVESGIGNREVILCDDGFIRDITGVYGKYRMSTLTEKAIKLIVEALAELRIESAAIFFDSAVSFSGELSRLFGERAKEMGVALEAKTVRKGDLGVKECDGVACSSDRGIISGARELFDLAGYVLPEKTLKKL